MPMSAQEVILLPLLLLLPLTLPLSLLWSFNVHYSRNIWVSQYQNVKPFWVLLHQEVLGGGDGDKDNSETHKSFESSHTEIIVTIIATLSFFLQARFPSLIFTACDYLVEIIWLSVGWITISVCSVIPEMFCRYYMECFLMCDLG